MYWMWAPQKVVNILKMKYILYFNVLIKLMVVIESAADRKDWVDPGDMLRYDFVSKSMKAVKNDRIKSQVKKVVNEAELKEDAVAIYKNPSLYEEEKDSAVIPNFNEGPQMRTVKCEDCEMKYMKRFVHHLLNHLNPNDFKEAGDFGGSEVTEMIYDVQINVNQDDLKLLKNYITLDEPRPKLNDVNNVISRLIYSAKLRTVNNENPSYFTSFYQLPFSINYNENFIIFGTTIITVIISIYLLRYLTLAGLILISIIATVAVSATMEYIYLKQEAEAEQLFQQSQIEGVPKECQPSQLNHFESVYNFIKTDIFGAENKCRSYYKTMVVNHQFEITPAKVFTSMAGKVSVTLAGIAGKSILYFYNNLTEGKSFMGLFLYLPVVITFALLVIWITFPIIIKSIPSIFAAMNRQHGGRRMVTNANNRIEDIRNASSDIDHFSRVQGIRHDHYHCRQSDCCSHHTESVIKSVKPSKQQQKGIKTMRSNKALEKIETHENEEEEQFHDVSDEIANVSPTRPRILIYKDGETQT